MKGGRKTFSIVDKSLSKKDLKLLIQYSNGIISTYREYVEQVEKDIDEIIDCSIGVAMTDKEILRDCLTRLVEIQTHRFKIAEKEIGFIEQGINHIKEKNSGGVSDEEIEKAKSYPIDQIVDFDKYDKRKCLFHLEKTPSMKYYKDTNTVHCFGECGRTWDSISVYQREHGCGFVDAIKAINSLW